MCSKHRSKETLQRVCGCSGSVGVGKFVSLPVMNNGVINFKISTIKKYPGLLSGDISMIYVFFQGSKSKCFNTNNFEQPSKWMTYIIRSVCIMIRIKFQLNNPLRTSM